MGVAIQEGTGLSSTSRGFRLVSSKVDGVADIIYGLRYHIYVELMGRRQTHADHRQKTVIEPLDEEADNYLALKDGVPIGTIRRNRLGDEALAYYRKLYRSHIFDNCDLGNVSVTTKLMVLPGYQNSIYPIRLIKEYARIGYTEGVRIDLLDCNSHLIPFFERMGYFSYRGWAFHKEFGTVRPMFLAVDALNYMEKLGSFLLSSAQGRVSDGQYEGYNLIARHAEIPRDDMVRSLSEQVRQGMLDVGQAA